MTSLLRSIATACIATLVLHGTALAADEPTLETVKTVDLDLYSGRWYEISRLPMWFERNCVGDVTATYTLRSDQKMDVVNRCRTKDKMISAKGIAAVPDAAQPGQLRVRFAPDWLSWFPIVWGDYWILDLDPEYRWVLVGAPSRAYLWILARTPSLDAATVQALKQRAASLDFEVEEMIDVSNTAQ